MFRENNTPLGANTDALHGTNQCHDIADKEEDKVRFGRPWYSTTLPGDFERQLAAREAYESVFRGLVARLYQRPMHSRFQSSDANSTRKIEPSFYLTSPKNTQST